MVQKRIRRSIADIQYRYNKGYEKHWAVGGSITLTLKGCGHVVFRKLSQGVPKTGLVFCTECEELRDGRIYYQQIGEGPMIRWSWDAETGFPVGSEVQEGQVAALLQAAPDKGIDG